MDISNREELISTYLDGELDAEQKKRVEQLLAEDQSAAQLLDEYRAVRSSLRSLPTYKLERDFADQVVQQAERADSAGQDLRPATAGGGGDPFAKRDLRRTFLWSGLAIAVAILLMLYSTYDLGSVARQEADRESPDTADTVQAESTSARATTPQMSARDREVPSTPAPLESLRTDGIADDSAVNQTSEDDHPLQKELLRRKRQGPRSDVAAAKDAPSDELQRRKIGPGPGQPTTAPVDSRKLAEESEEKTVNGRNPQGIAVYTYAYVDSADQRDKLNRSLGKARNLADQAQPRDRESAALSLSRADAAQERLSSLVGAARLAQVRSTPTGVEYVYELNGTHAEIDHCLARLSSDAVVRLVSVADRPGAANKNNEAKQEGAGHAGSFKQDNAPFYERGAGRRLPVAPTPASGDDKSTDFRQAIQAEKAKKTPFEAAGDAAEDAAARPESDSGVAKPSRNELGAGAKRGVAADSDDDSSPIPSPVAAAPAKSEKPIQRVLLVFRFDSSLPAAAAIKRPSDPAGRTAAEVEGDSK